MILDLKGEKTNFVDALKIYPIVEEMLDEWIKKVLDDEELLKRFFFN